MHRFPTDLSYNPPSARNDASPPPLPPTDDAIEAIIQQATSARPSERPLRDTRTQLFVGNLPYRVRWQDLKDLFRKAGTVLRADVSLGPDNRSRGYGTVLLATAEDAGRAVDMFNGYSWQTRVLEVRLDRLLPEYEAQALSVPGSATSSGHISLPSHHGSFSSISDDQDFSTIYHSNNDPNSCRNLFVGNLPFHCQWQDLKDLFRQAGTILRADVALGPDGRSRGFGTVTFATEYDAERALRMFNGYEYNNRTLKVHFDKHPAGAHVSAPSVPPATAGANTQAYAPHVHNHPPQMQIKLPPGFMYDFGPPTGPNSPYEMFTHLQQQAQAQMLHQPQAQLYQKLTMQQRQQQQRQPNIFGQQSPSLDIESLTNSLAHTHLSKPSSSSSTTIDKPPSLSTHTSTSSATGSSSEHSLASTSASSVPSPSQASPFSQQQQQPPQQIQKNQQKSKQPQHHPHHPGPISLPPLMPTFPISPHTPLAQHAMSYSPLHHPNIGSSYQIYHSAHPSTAYQQHPQASVLTPHGLPPITPSMPPFNFLPTSQPRHSPQSQRRSHRHHPSSSSSNASGGTASASSSVPPSDRSSSVAPGSSSAPGDQQQQQQTQYQYALPSPQFMIPLPSPGLYLPHPQPSPPVHMRLNLSGIPTMFSPGVAMSPGTFYGRPGEVLPNPNPFINAAVGAPVHVHSPTGHPTHGAYFYAMSSPKKGPPTGTEPKGYFDPMYFPPGGGDVGGSRLVNEIMRDSVSEGKVKGKEEERDADGIKIIPSASGAGKSAEAANTSSSLASSRHTRGVTGSEANELTQTTEKEQRNLWNEGATISRTHSVGHARKHESSDAAGPGTMSRGNSDPIRGGVESAASLSLTPSQ